MEYMPISLTNQQFLFPDRMDKEGAGGTQRERERGGGKMEMKKEGKE